MGGILVKWFTGVGGEEEQDQKIAAFGSSYRGGGGFSTGEKKGLAKQDLS
jgi:hypothetical protein